MRQPKRLRIGEVLLDEGMLTKDELDKALADQRASGEMLGKLLVDRGVVTNASLVQALVAGKSVSGAGSFTILPGRSLRAETRDENM